MSWNVSLFDLLARAAAETWHMTVLAAPFLLLGLAMAGLVHVLLPTRVVRRFLGRPGLGGAALAAGVGVPLPVCSCGVVPIAVEMKRKKASDAASLSFITTTPESGVDSVLFTWALMGPVLAIARPIAAFFTAMLGAVIATFGLKPSESPDDFEADDDACCGSGCEGEAQVAEHASTEATLESEAESDEEEDERSGLWKGTLRPALGYGFGELLDDIAFWLVLGLALGGVLSAVLPRDLEALGLGGGFLPMLVMLGVGVPLYICASASTPVAAALLAKGLSPGAALVFLLAGPATNAASLVVLGRTFGGRFIRIYLLAVALGSLASGLLLDFLIGFFGWTLAIPTAAAAHEAAGPWELAATVALLALLAASAWRGSMRRGWGELKGGVLALGRVAG